MSFNRNAWAAHGSTSLFVCCCGRRGLRQMGLAHASAFGFLLLRFVLALTVLLAIAPVAAAGCRRWARVSVALTGFLLIGCYSICYLLALDHGVTPGVLATLLGAQPS